MFFQGDDFKINVTNYLHDTAMEASTSLVRISNIPLCLSLKPHSIGYQKQSNWADDTTGATQRAIKPHKSFLHEFNAHSQSGTCWYHSHSSSPYCDGLRGPLVIYDPEDPHKHLYDVDNGTYSIFRYLNETLICSPENTVITPSDRYRMQYFHSGFQAHCTGIIYPVAKWTCLRLRQTPR